MTSFFITDHAIERGRQRLGFDETKLMDTVSEAVLNGLGPAEATGALRRLMYKKCFENKTANYCVFHNRILFLFRDRALVTLFPLKGKFIPNRVDRNDVDRKPYYMKIKKQKKKEKRFKY